MKKIIFIIFLLNSCGFSSYYRDTNLNDKDVAPNNIRNQLKLTKIEIVPTDNADRLLKEDLLARIERFDNNDKIDYRYIMLIVTNYNLVYSAYNPSGVSLGLRIIFTTKYIIVDTKKINISDDIETEEVSIERLPSESIIEKEDINKNDNISLPTLTGNPKRINEAKDEKFERQSQTLRNKYTIVSEGQIVNNEEYLTSTTLLYDDYTQKEKALEIVGQVVANDLFYTMIANYSDYLETNYNTNPMKFYPNINTLDIVVDRLRNKISPIVVEYFSIPALRDAILDLVNTANAIKK